MSNQKRLQSRLDKLEELHDKRVLSDSQFDVLTALALCEAGLLSFQEQLESVLE